MTPVDPDEAVRRNRELRPDDPRPDSFIWELAVDPQVGAVLPWCDECADWHQPDEPHSAL